MKNFVSNSTFTVNHGNIQIGDITVLQLTGIEEYKTLVANIQKIFDEKEETERKYNSVSDQCKQDVTDTTAADFLDYLGGKLLALEENLTKANSQLDKFTNNLLSALEICLTGVGQVW